VPYYAKQTKGNIYVTSKFKLFHLVLKCASYSMFVRRHTMFMTLYCLLLITQLELSKGLESRYLINAVKYTTTSHTLYYGCFINVGFCYIVCLYTQASKLIGDPSIGTDIELVVTEVQVFKSDMVGLYFMFHLCNVW